MLQLLENLRDKGGMGIKKIALSWIHWIQEFSLLESQNLKMV